LTIRDTIFALSSGGLPSGVAIVRLSGSRAMDVCRLLSGAVPKARQASLRWIRKRNGDAIDQGVVLVFPGPTSFTGEDCVEFQLHGGRAVVKALLQELECIEGLRHAEAGEFSRRAFDNGRLDLVEIEGLSDLIAADTEMQRKLALEQSGGTLSRLYDGWAEQLTRIRALIEAELDFPDEDDVPGAMSDTLWPKLAQLVAEIRQHVDGAAAAEIMRDGFRIAIVGAPNAGKSSLLNVLAKRDVAIVTEIAGTTRDVLGVDLDLGGYLVHVMDTAGIRETDDVVEREGVRRAFKSIEQADLVLKLQASDGSPFEPKVGPGKRVLAVVSKSDLLEPAAARHSGVSYISSTTGDGFDSLTKRILEEVSASTARAGGLAPARARQTSYLRKAIEDIERCLAAETASLELRAEYLRLASHSVGKITGRVDVEDLLDVIFSEFCIGK
jgi:tRNA modification GTPase